MAEKISLAGVWRLGWRKNTGTVDYERRPLNNLIDVEVPADTCPRRVTSSKRSRLLKLAFEANFNYLRVWGGGIYEHDEFYDRCDRLGIMVWQDFMFSCAEYPDFDDDFMREIRLEIDHQTRRLRSHPCLVMWCGNNEIEQQCGQEAIRARRPNGRYYGERIFKDVIPEILSKLDPSRPYRGSSGCGASHEKGEGVPLKYESGVVHDDIFDELIKRGRKRIPSFLGEWYTAAPPLMKSIRRFIPDGHLRLDSPVWRMHDFVGEQFRDRVDQFVAPLANVGFEDTMLTFQSLQMENGQDGN